MTILIIFITGVILTSALLLLIKIVSLFLENETQKWISFECGFDSQTPSHNRFSIQFFLVIILFLIFDIEISLIFPFPFSNINIKITYTMLIFIFILLLGLLHE